MKLNLSFGKKPYAYVPGACSTFEDFLSHYDAVAEAILQKRPFSYVPFFMVSDKVMPRTSYNMSNMP